jgi:hypothetical protein
MMWRAQVCIGVSAEFARRGERRMREKERGEGAQDVSRARGNVCWALVSRPPRRCHDVAMGRAMVD